METKTFDRFFKFTSWAIGAFAVLTFLMAVGIFALIGYSVVTGKSVAPPIRIEIEHK